MLTSASANFCCNSFAASALREYPAATRIPRPIRRSHIARPIPRPPPVTNATCPCMSAICGSSLRSSPAPIGWNRPSRAPSGFSGHGSWYAYTCESHAGTSDPDLTSHVCRAFSANRHLCHMTSRATGPQRPSRQTQGTKDVDMASQREVVVTSGVRTAVGRFGGALKDIPPTELGAKVVAEAVGRTGVDPAEVGHTVFANVIHTDTQDMYLARVVSVNGGVPPH